MIAIARSVSIFLTLSASLIVFAAQTIAQDKGGQCDCWFDSKTGKRVASGPILATKTGFADGSGVRPGIEGGKLEGITPDIGDPNRAFDPNSGRNFFRGPCPPPETGVTTPKPSPTPQTHPTPKNEVRVGYLFQHAFDETVKNLNGFHTGVYYNIGHVQIGGEFTGSFGSTITTTPIVLDTSLSRFTYLFGPQFKLYENDKARVFVHSLFGGVHDKTTVKIGTGTPGSFSANAFAMEFGGGFDIRVNKHFFVTPVTVDYLRTHFGGQWQNNVLITSGIGFEFGKK